MGLGLTLEKLEGLNKEEIINSVVKQLEILDEKTLIEELTGIREGIPIPGRIIMSKFTDKNLQELRDTNYGQIRSAQNQTFNSKSKKELIEIEMEGQTEFSDPTTGEDCPNGQVWRLTIIRDAEGNILRKQRGDWSYYEGYPEGKRPVDLYVGKILDANDDLISANGVKHFTDGSPPVGFEGTSYTGG